MFWNPRVGNQRVFPTQGNHSTDQRALEVRIRIDFVLVQHREKVFLSPLIRGPGVDEQPTGRCAGFPPAVVDGHFCSTTGYAFSGCQIKLTGRVVTRMAGYTFFIKNRLDVVNKGDVQSCGGGGC